MNKKNISFPLLLSSIMPLVLVGCSTASTQNMQPLAYSGLANSAEMGKITPSSRPTPVKIAHEPQRVHLSATTTSMLGKLGAIQLGSQTPCGMVVNLRGPLAKVQVGHAAYWVLISKLDDAQGCIERR